MKKIVGLFICLIASPLLAQLGPTNPPANVTLAWDASTNLNVVSFNVYYGVASRVYTNVVSVTATTVTISNLIRGVTYYFAATSVTTDGLESAFSNEISYSVESLPVPPVLRLGVSPLVQVFNGTRSPSTAYQVQRRVQR